MSDQSFEVNLKQSINVDTISEDFKSFGDISAPLITNTGIERNGGITNIYEKQTDYGTEGEYAIAEDGSVLALTASATADYLNVIKDGVNVGQVSAYGLERTVICERADDVFLDTASYTTCVLKGASIIITEYDFDNVVLHTRTVTFANLASVMQFYTSLSFVKYATQTYADSQEWALRLGEQVIILKESTPAQDIIKSLANANMLGIGFNIRSAYIANMTLVVAGDNGKIASFDGNNWKYPDGSGYGIGLYNDGTAMGGVSIESVFYASPLGRWVFGGGSGRLTSCDYQTNTFVLYNAGSGLCNNGTAIGNNTIYAMGVLGLILMIAGGAGQVASWNGTAWTNSSTASGTTNNATAVSTDTILSMTLYGASIVIASSLGKVASTNGTVWINYNAGSGLCNNGTVIGSVPIYCMDSYATTLCVCGQSGRIGSWNGTAWTVYTAGSGLCNNGTVISTDDVTAVHVISGAFIFGGSTGKIGSYSGGVFYNYNSGNFYSNTGVIAGSLKIVYMGLNSWLNKEYIVSVKVFNTFLTATTGYQLYTDLTSGISAYIMAGVKSLNYTSMLRDEGLNYFCYAVGNMTNKICWIASNQLTIRVFNGAYLLPQTKGGYTRYLISDRNPISPAFAYIGYILLSATYFNQPTFYTSTSISISELLQIGVTYGYNDIVYKTATGGTNIYNCVSSLSNNSILNTPIVINAQGNTNTLINGYGKLTNNLQLQPTKPFELRVGMIQGQSAFLSCGILDSIQSDTLGVLITNTGEFDDSYQPQIKTDDTILYKYNGMFIIKKISKNITTRLQAITPTLFKINTITPLNILDTETWILQVGSCDYNGRMLFNSTVAPGISQKVASIFEGQYSNGIDTGDKVVTINPITASSVQIVGARIPVVGTGTGSYAIDTYIEDVYSFSTLNDGSELVKPENADLIYVASTIVPLAIGSNYNNGLSNGPNNTVFLKPNYDGTSIGNDIAGIFTGFKLFGQNYLFDTRNFYTADIDAINGIFISKMFLCPATGLKYIASTPTRIYFLSKFDNSIFIFDGGRSLNKFQRMNSMETINSGIFSVTDNTLLLDTDNTFIWVRDEIISQNSKATDQTSLKYYNTDNGLVIGNNNSNWTYTYNNVSGASVVPLKIKTGYYGFNLNVKSILSAWVITIYNEAKTAISVKGTSYVIDEDIAREQITNWNINPVDYNDGGYVRIRLQPQYQRSLGTSLQIETSSKVFIIAILPEFATGETALVPNARSR